MTATMVPPGGAVDVSKPNNNGASGASGETATPSAAGVATAAPFTLWQHPTMIEIIDAFVLGWKIVELQRRLQIAEALTKELPPSSDPGSMANSPAGKELGDPVWMTSIWRADFRQITATHAREYADASTHDTLYEPPGGHWDTITTLRCLYPQDGLDYTEIGLPHDVDGGTMPACFSIYDVTRRGINALALLYSYSKDELIADTIVDYQLALLQQMELIPAQDDSETTSQGDGETTSQGDGETTSQGDGETTSQGDGETTSQGDGRATQTKLAGSPQGGKTVSHKEEPPELDPQEAARREEARREDARRQGVAALTAAVALLLDTWGSFLREQYYAGPPSAANATKLQAFESGRTLADLTWSISAATIGMEIAGDPKSKETSKLLDQWNCVFSQYNVVQAQHFIAALCGAADDVYMQFKGNAPDAGTDASYDPDLPSNTGHAIKHCLDHWRASIAWLNARREQQPQTLAFYKQLRGALIEQSDVWQSLLTGRQRLGLFTVESVMSRLVQDVFSDLETEVAQDVRQEDKGLLAATDQALGPAKPIIVGAGVLLLIVVVVAIAMAVLHPGDLSGNGVWGVLGIGSLGVALAGLAGVRGAPGATTPSSPPAATTANVMAEQVGNLIQAVEASTRESFKAAYAQLRRELAALNYAIGVSYPLIESFVLFDDGADIKTIQDDYSFMTQVIWTSEDRREEVEDIVRAALGPVGLLSGAALRKQGKNGQQKQHNNGQQMAAPGTLADGQDATPGGTPDAAADPKPTDTTAIARVPEESAPRQSVP